MGKTGTFCRSNTNHTHPLGQGQPLLRVLSDPKEKACYYFTSKVKSLGPRKRNWVSPLL